MAAGDLTTTAKVRDYLGLTTDDANAKLDALVTSSSAWFVSQLGRPVLSATYTETRDGNGTSDLVLYKWPVISVTSVTVDGTAIAARATVNDSGWTRDGSKLTLTGYVFTSGVANVVVVYVAGYATVPTDIEQAVTEHVALRYRDADRQGLASAAGGGDSVGYNPSAALAYIHGVLDTYRELVTG
jgi:hypothetical protein